MQKSLEEAKEIIRQVLPFARQMMGLVEDFGRDDMVSMYLSDTHISFWANLSNEDKTTIEGTLWKDSEKFELRVDGELVKEYGRDYERAVS